MNAGLCDTVWKWLNLEQALTFPAHPLNPEKPLGKLTSVLLALYNGSTAWQMQWHLQQAYTPIPRFILVMCKVWHQIGQCCLYCKGILTPACYHTTQMTHSGALDVIFEQGFGACTLVHAWGNSYIHFGLSHFWSLSPKILSRKRDSFRPLSISSFYLNRYLWPIKSRSLNLNCTTKSPLQF